MASMVDDGVKRRQATGATLTVSVGLLYLTDHLSPKVTRTKVWREGEPRRTFRCCTRMKDSVFIVTKSLTGMFGDREVFSIHYPRQTTGQRLFCASVPFHNGTISVQYYYSVSVLVSLSLFLFPVCDIKKTLTSCVDGCTVG